VAKRSNKRTLGQALTDVIAPLAPSLALGREVAMTQRAVLRQRAAHYQGAGRTARGSDFRINRTDAIEAARADSARLSWIGRDMLRNNPRAVKIRRQLVGNVVGAGIQPTVAWKGKAEDPRKAQLEEIIRRHCLTTDWDTDGMRSMLGQQGLGFGTIVGDGEVLFRRRWRRTGDGFVLPFQVQVMEADFLNRDIDGDLGGGRYAVQGIEFDRIGRRVAYHLYSEHPGGWRGGIPKTTRVTAENVIHAFEATRPGQQRGVTWFAPVITLLHELQKYQDGQVKRQEIAALFAGIMTSAKPAEELDGEIGTLEAGTILQIGEDEGMEFTEPPSVEGYEPFMRITDRTIAAGMGITYEALTGDYSNVNYTSGRMGRMDVDPNVRDWQQNLMIAQVCARFAGWIAEGAALAADIPANLYEIGWTPPVRPVIDPTKDYKAGETATRSGQKSRRQLVREQGGDPAKIEAEIAEERAWARSAGLVFTSDAGASATSAGDTGGDSKKDEDNGQD